MIADEGVKKKVTMVKASEKGSAKGVLLLGGDLSHVSFRLTAPSRRVRTTESITMHWRKDLRRKLVD